MPAVVDLQTGVEQDRARREHLPLMEHSLQVRVAA
jgi:hypothetical protein